MPRTKKTPTILITYLCTRCTWEFTRTELDKAKCTLCEKSDRLHEVKREPVTPQAVEAGMMRSIDRMMTSLEKAYEAGKNEGMNDADEILLLEAMVKGKNLEKHVQKAFGRTPAKAKRRS